MHHRAGRARGERFGDDRRGRRRSRRAGRRTDRRAGACACRSKRRSPRTARSTRRRCLEQRRARSRAGSWRPRPAQRTTLTSSNGITRAPIVWPCSWPLPATASTSPARRSVQRRGDRLARGRRSRCAPGHAAQHRGADRRRVLAARIVVGDDGHIRETVRRRRPSAGACRGRDRRRRRTPRAAAPRCAGAARVSSRSSASGVWA